MGQEDYQQLYDEYVKRFFDFDLAVSRTQLVALCAAHIFHDFPDGLPEQSRKEIEATIERAIKMLLDGLSRMFSMQSGEAGDGDGGMGEGPGSPYSAPLVSLFLTGHF